MSKSRYLEALAMLVDATEQTLGVRYADIIPLASTIEELERDSGTEATLERSSPQVSVYRIQGPGGTYWAFFADVAYMRYSLVLDRVPREETDFLLWLIAQMHFVVHPWPGRSKEAGRAA
jgi:hypothetical protein